MQCFLPLQQTGVCEGEKKREGEAEKQREAERRVAKRQTDRDNDRGREREKQRQKKNGDKNRQRRKGENRNLHILPVSLAWIPVSSPAAFSTESKKTSNELVVTCRRQVGPKGQKDISRIRKIALDKVG